MVYHSLKYISENIQNKSKLLCYQPFIIFLSPSELNLNDFIQSKTFQYQININSIIEEKTKKNDIELEDNKELQNIKDQFEITSPQKPIINTTLNLRNRSIQQNYYTKSITQNLMKILKITKMINFYC